MGGEGNLASGRPAVFFDLDGTWFRWQLFDEWIKEMIKQGLFPEIVYAMAKSERQAYQNREGRFGSWVMKQVEAYSAFMAGTRVADVKFAAHQMIAEKGKRVHVFTRSLSEAASDAGFLRLIISGSPQAVVEAFAEANGINIFIGTEHEEQNGRYTGVTTKEWVNDKREAVESQARLYDIDLKESAAIGDGWSDRLMLEMVGYPICFNPEKQLRLLAQERGWPVVVEKKDDLHMYLGESDKLARLLDFADFLPPRLARAMECAYSRLHV